jgi:hypothetical protein
MGNFQDIFKKIKGRGKSHQNWGSPLEVFIHGNVNAVLNFLKISNPTSSPPLLPPPLPFNKKI